MLESQIHGTSHWRDHPPPLKMVNVRKLPEADIPGWGSNAPNLAAWEALEHVAEREGCNDTSRILPLKDLNYNIVPSNEPIGNFGQQQRGDDIPEGPVRYNRLKEEVKIEGKMVADGMDASQGDYGDQSDKLMPAVSWSTRRRFLRRKARRDASEAAERVSAADLEASTNASLIESRDLLSDGGSECIDVVVELEITIERTKSDAYETEENTRNYVISSKLNILELESSSSILKNDDNNQADFTIEFKDSLKDSDLDATA